MHQRRLRLFSHIFEFSDCIPAKAAPLPACDIRGESLTLNHKQISFIIIIGNTQLSDQALIHVQDRSVVVVVVVVVVQILNFSLLFTAFEDDSERSENAGVEKQARSKLENTKVENTGVEISRHGNAGVEIVGMVIS